MRWTAFVSIALLVGGCAPLQTKLQKVQADKSALDTQYDERSATSRCDQVALPGTTQHMTCMLGAIKAAGESQAPK